MAQASQQPSPPSRPLPPPRPLPEGIIDHGHRYTLIQRVHCLVLITEGLPPAEIEKKTGIKPRT